MSNDEIEAKVKEILLDLLDTDEAEIKPDASLVNDLGASSVDLVEIVAELENTYDLQISDEDAERIRSVKDVIDYVKAAATG